MSQVKAVEKENVTMRAGDCSVTILPLLGGKIASIRIGDKELLQSPLSAYAPRSRTMSFDAGDASGWDECLPSVAACSVETTAGAASVPDHGDLWRVEWKSSDHAVIRDGAQAVALHGECFSLPLTLHRTIGLAATSTGW